MNPASNCDGVIVTDSSGRVTFMNAAAAELTGRSERGVFHRKPSR
jgi:PAS domain-containing protein